MLLVPYSFHCPHASPSRITPETVCRRRATVVGMLLLGVDPGLSGGLAFLEAGRLETMPLPPIYETCNLLKARRPSHVFLEKAQAMPKNGAVSMFNYGSGYGQLIGALHALGLPFTLVAPALWTRVVHMGAPGNLAAKQKSLIVAHRLFPGHSFLASDRCRKEHDGMIDAALLVEYGRRTLG